MITSVVVVVVVVSVVRIVAVVRRVIGVRSGPPGVVSVVVGIPVPVRPEAKAETQSVAVAGEIVAAEEPVTTKASEASTSAKAVATVEAVETSAVETAEA